MKKIALTGATGYVGGRLLPRLIERGYQVVCLARHPDRLQKKLKPPHQAVRVDVMDIDSLVNALRDVEVAFYLVHSLAQTHGFEKDEVEGASNFSRAAKQCGVKRIVYLGGLGEYEAGLSPHLRSRQRVGDILRASGVPVTEFRASIIIGSGSLSFELVRGLVEVLPIMITPRWVSSLAQPIGIDDVLSYLLEGIEQSIQKSVIYEIGGSDVVSYKDLMKEYARQRKLKRIFIPVPFLTPFLSSLWLGLITPLFARIGRKLIDSIRNNTVVHDIRAINDFSVRPKGVSFAIEEALRSEEQGYVQTRWSDSLASGMGVRSWAGLRFGTRRVDSRTIKVNADASAAFAPIQRIGGKSGWYYGNWLWGIRGAIDLLIGGVGVRRGRKHPVELHPGDVLDCWRVEVIEENRRLRLVAEMKLPGRAWLEFEVTPLDGGSEIRQTAIFDPLGLSGFLYWYGIYPLHEFVFRGMLNGIKKEIECRREK